MTTTNDQLHEAVLTIIAAQVLVEVVTALVEEEWVEEILQTEQEEAVIVADNL